MIKTIQYELNEGILSIQEIEYYRKCMVAIALYPFASLIISEETLKKYIDVITWNRGLPWVWRWIETIWNCIIQSILRYGHQPNLQQRTAISIQSKRWWKWKQYPFISLSKLCGKTNNVLITETYVIRISHNVIEILWMDGLTRISWDKNILDGNTTNTR